jgi:hypothetical protein
MYGPASVSSCAIAIKKYRRDIWESRTVNGSRIVRARVGLNGDQLSDHPTCRESRENDATWSNAPVGRVSTYYLHRLEAIGDAVLAVLGDQSVVVQLSHEGCPSGPAQFRGILSLNLLRAAFQDESRKSVVNKPLCNIVTFGVD